MILLLALPFVANSTLPSNRMRGCSLSNIIKMEKPREHPINLEVQSLQKIDIYQNTVYQLKSESQCNCCCPSALLGNNFGIRTERMAASPEMAVADTALGLKPCQNQYRPSTLQLYMSGTQTSWRLA